MKIKFYILIVCIAFLSANVFGQEKLSNQNNSLNLVFFKVKNQNNFPENPINCEDLLRILEDISAKAWIDRDATLLFVSRLGDGEKVNKLNNKRLSYFNRYFNERETKAVFTIGEKVGGYGRVDVYILGKLTHSIPFEKNITPLKMCRGL